MSEFFTLLYFATLFVWIGFGFGQRAERKRRHPSHGKLVDALTATAKDLKQKRAWVGEGPTIETKTTWRFGEIGSFGLTMTEALTTEEPQQ